MRWFSFPIDSNSCLCAPVKSICWPHRVVMGSAGRALATALGLGRSAPRRFACCIPTQAVMLPGGMLRMATPCLLRPAERTCITFAGMSVGYGSGVAVMSRPVRPALTAFRHVPYPQASTRRASTTWLASRWAP